jgi:hypothetical protein
VTRVQIRLLAALLVAALFVAGAAGGTAFAQAKGPKAQKVEKLQAEALAAYDDLEFEKAKKLLIQAIQVGKGKGVPPSLQARSHMTLGVVYAAGLKDSTRGLEEFIKALRIDPDTQIDPGLKNPKLSELFLRARETLNLGGAGEASEEPQLEHDPIENGQGGQAAAISVLLPRGLEVGRVELYFRPAGQGEFQARLLERRGARSYVGEIPAASMAAPAMEYYIEAKTESGRVLARAGSQKKPFKINVLAGTGLTSAPNIPTTKPETSGFRRFSLMLGVGTGLGYLLTDPAANVAQPGFAIAPFHISVDFGIYFADQWQIVAYGRIQVVEFTGMGELQVKRHFGTGKFRGNLHVGAGGGQSKLRLPTTVTSTNPLTGAPQQLDEIVYVPRGPGEASVGGGINYRFTPGIGWVADISARFFFPDFAPVIDFTTGLEFYF